MIFDYSSMNICSIPCLIPFHHLFIPFINYPLFPIQFLLNFTSHRFSNPPYFHKLLSLILVSLLLSLLLYNPSFSLWPWSKMMCKNLWFPYHLKDIIPLFIFFQAISLPPKSFHNIFMPTMAIQASMANRLNHIIHNHHKIT